jgi:ubiquinone/menaquinone biosynthesis C-methylase UbiE
MLARDATNMAASPSHKDVERFEVSWMQRALFEPAHQATFALATQCVPQPERVLDVGCGTGKLLRRYETVWPQALLIDVDPAEGMVKMALRLTPNATFLKGMAEALPLPDASIDLALSTISFHHWQDQAAGIREIARVLRPGGSFILVNLPFPPGCCDSFNSREYA